MTLELDRGLEEHHGRSAAASPALHREQSEYNGGSPLAHASPQPAFAASPPARGPGEQSTLSLGCSWALERPKLPALKPCGHAEG
jgi:hypothetical protein